MLRKPRQKSATPLQLMQLVGPQGLMRRIDVDALVQAREKGKTREEPRRVIARTNTARLTK